MSACTVVDGTSYLDIDYSQVTAPEDRQAKPIPSASIRSKPRRSLARMHRSLYEGSLLYLGPWDRRT